MEIFADPENSKQVRSLYLIKAVQNILGFRSLHQSSKVLMQIITSIQRDEKECEEEDQAESVSLSSDLQQ